MNLSFIPGIKCYYDGKCTASRSSKCCDCENNKHEAREGKESYFKKIFEKIESENEDRILKEMKSLGITILNEKGEFKSALELFEELAKLLLEEV